MKAHTPAPSPEMSFVELDALRSRMGLKIVEVCRAGGFDSSTYSRWRRWAAGKPGGSKPHRSSLTAVRNALHDEWSRRFPV